MRILMVIGQYRPVIGGAERQCELLARALVARGHHVLVLTTRTERYIPTQEHVGGVTIVRVAYPILHIRGRRVGFGILAPILLWWNVRRYAPQHDVVHAHQALWPAFVACMVARRRHVPIVVKLGNSGERFDLTMLRRSHWYGPFAAWYLRRAITRWIATSTAVRVDLLAAGIPPERIAEIPNGVALPSTVIRTPRADVVRFLAVGTLTPKKNFATLIEAFALLPDVVRQRCRLTIVGDGPEREALARHIAAYDLSALVSLAGSMADPTPAYVAHDVFILPSRTEGLSNAALEAMAHGLPLLVSAAGGNTDLVPDRTATESFAVGGSGILVDPLQPRMIGEAMAFLATRDGFRRSMGVRSRSIAEGRFDIDRICDAYESLYARVTRPRIVHLLTFLDSQTGGMERQALQLAERFCADGYDVSFVTCVHRSLMRRHELRCAGALQGIPVYRIPLAEGNGRMNAVRFACGALLILLAFRRRYDIIHAHQLWTSGLIASAARRLLPRKRVIMKNCSGGVIGDIRQLQRFPLQRYVLRFLSRGCDEFIAVSEETSREMRDAELSPITFVPNGVDNEWFAPADPDTHAALRRALLEGRMERHIVLFVGRLVPKKRVAVLIAAVAQLAGDALLLIVGDGPLRASLEQCVRDLGIERHVCFLGEQSDVRRYYQLADVFVLPSENEGLPNVLLEAMSCGVPSIGTDIPSIRSVIVPGVSGLLVPLDDVQALASALYAVLEDPARAQALGRQARMRISEQYGFPMIMESYARVYRVLSARSP